ncbi:exodeoxyribonuclease V subunit alpha [Rhizobacter sp. Root1221]|uniref:exodeoxyribonuclease V subunit alpha n=1 Tax=Rhizobacter sp. Root1221 TaxID=1736433 RepID=UPI0009E91F9F|nr:exodeoxyribonuclease V subunit alpha [Rhizobacter sp. Root1221]
MTPGIQMDAFDDLLPPEKRPPLSGAEALAALKAWADAGSVRHLDHMFARFMAERAPHDPAPVLMAAAMLVHMEGRGHTCLVVDELVSRAHELLGWTDLALEAWDTVAARLPRQTAHWLAALRSSPVVGHEAAGSEPLVLSGERLYLRRYWLDEQRVGRQVARRVAAHDTVDEAVARRWLDALFPPAPAFDWQKFACAVALRARLSVITGGPGTGKTYTAARLLALLWAVDPAPARLRIALAAPTGKAAARLKQSISTALADLQAKVGDTLPLTDWVSHLESARTLHSLLGARPDTRRLQHDAAHPLDVDVLLVDEASMVHLEMMASLLDALPPNARIVLLGDKDQLASVEAGAVLGDLCRGAEEGRYDTETRRYAEAVSGQRLPDAYAGGGPALAQQTVMLRESRRFEGAIGQLALAVNEGATARATVLLRDARHAGELAWVSDTSAHGAVRLAVAGYRPCLDLLRDRPAADEQHAAWAHAVLTAFDRFRLLCAVREGEWGVAGLNEAVLAALAQQKLLSPRGEWYEGRPVMVTRNIASAGVFNGDIGIALRAPGEGAPLRVYFLEGDAVRSVGVSRLPDVETAFAMTVHKSQGSEFEHTVLVLPETPSRVLTRELVYTGITRARKRFTLVTGRERAFAEALAQQTRRYSGLLDVLAG